MSLKRSPEFVVDLALLELVRLQILDVPLNIHSDSPTFLEYFTAHYGRFVLAHGESSRLAIGTSPPPLRCVLLTRAHAPFPAPTLLIDGEPLTLPDPTLLAALAIERILSALWARVRGCLLLHAGAVTKQGQALALLGPSGSGKSTLTLALLRNGFGFLSDECAAIRYRDRRVLPFPRALRLCTDIVRTDIVRTDTVCSDTVCSDTVSRRKGVPCSGGAHNFFGKVVLDIDALQEGALSRPAPLVALFFLSACDPLTPQQQWLEVILERCAPTFGDGLGEGSAELTHTDSLTRLRVLTEQPQRVYRTIQARAQVDRIRILEASTKPRYPPSFDQRAHLIEISQSRAAQALLRHLICAQSALRQPALHLFDAARLLDGTRCYQLTPGPVEQQVALVQTLFPQVD